MILTATGAWYTASNNEKFDGASASYTFADFITIGVSGTDNSSIQAKTTLAGTETNLDNGSALHPGDKIYVTDGATVTFTASDKTHNFWYAVSTNGGTSFSTPVAWLASEKTGDDADVLYTTTLTKSITDTDSNAEWKSDGYYLIKTSLTQSDVASDTITVTITGCDVVVKACQYNNVKDAAAAADAMGITVA